jgi:hypothetical protein
MEACQLPDADRLASAREIFKNMEPLCQRILLPANINNRKPVAKPETHWVNFGFPEFPSGGCDNRKRQFSSFDDQLLLAGLYQHGMRNLEAIRKTWLMFKDVAEIRNRIKNLTCTRVQMNPIKQWKQVAMRPLIE